MRDELQELVDEVSRLLDAPATLEDADFTLLAFCAHDDRAVEAMDAVRTRSILTRGSPPATRRWFEEFGIAAAEGPLRTPADPDAGILTRLMLPVRHAGRTRGYLWLLDRGRIDPDDDADPALTAATALAAEAGRMLAERSADEDLGELLGAALSGSPPRREQAARALASALDDDTARVLVALVPAGGEPEAGWRLPRAGAISSVQRDPGQAPALAVLVPLPGAGDLRPVEALTASSLAGLPAGSVAGVSDVRLGLSDLTGQWREARAAARVAGAVPRFAPVAHWGDLGGWRPITQLPGPDPVVVRLLGDPVLTRTAEVFLDCAGRASVAARELSVHRQTLYYRLARIQSLTGLDLADGEHRLLLHTAVKAARLAR